MTPLTLEQAKDLIAQKYGKTTWHSLGYEFSEPYGREIPSKYFDEAAELYYQSHKAKAWEEGFKAFCDNEEPLFIMNSSNRDWTEDFGHENGNYLNKCRECGLQFNGHKRRVICKKCSTPNWAELAIRKCPEDTKDNKAWAGAWLEGEMVGYAKCMVEKVLIERKKVNPYIKL